MKIIPLLIAALLAAVLSGCNYVNMTPPGWTGAINATGTDIEYTSVAPDGTWQQFFITPSSTSDVVSSEYRDTPYGNDSIHHRSAGEGRTINMWTAAISGIIGYLAGGAAVP